MSDIYLTGASGRLGKYFTDEGLLPLNCDITKPQSIADMMSAAQPKIILHLAGISDVNYCEKIENHEKVIDVNLRGTYNLLLEAEKYGTKVVMLSTDHVFDGGGKLFSWGGAYSETRAPNPINFYGKSKLSAEALQETFSNFKVVRTSYLFDKERLEQEVGKSQPTFIHRSFMFIPQFVRNMMLYLNNWDKMPNLLHISGNTTVSWYWFMSEYLNDPNIPVHHKELHTDGYAPRPHYAGLTTKYKGLLPSYSYKMGLSEMENS